MGTHERVSLLTQDVGFPTAVRALLEGSAEYREWAGYIVQPGSPMYAEVLGFVVDELRGLPFDGSVGHAIPMRDDAQEAARRIADALAAQLDRVRTQQPWDPTIRDQLRDVFAKGWLELFKNEIYPDEVGEGVCYSVDLSASSSNGRDFEPSGVVIERFRVSRAGGAFHLLDNGSLKLSLHGGHIVVDVSEDERHNVHRGEWRKHRRT